jgi:hypothetical protein
MWLISNFIGTWGYKENFGNIGDFRPIKKKPCCINQFVMLIFLVHVIIYSCVVKGTPNTENISDLEEGEMDRDGRETHGFDGP